MGGSYDYAVDILMGRIRVDVASMERELANTIAELQKQRLQVASMI